MENTKFEFVDNIFMISVPKEWKQIESDRFRMVNNSESLEFSISNYRNNAEEQIEYTLEDLKKSSVTLFIDFVENGGYEAYDDFEVGKNYVYQAFAIDDETQYYYYTYRMISNKLVIINFCIRESGDYDEKTEKLIKEIGASISINFVIK